MIFKSRIKNQRFTRGFLLNDWRRHFAYHTLQQFQNTCARTPRHARHVILRASKQLRKFTRCFGHARVRRVNLIYHRYNGKTFLLGNVQIGKCLRLHALRSIHQQHRALHRRKRARNFVREIYVPRRIY